MADSSAAPFVVFSDDWGEHPSSCQHLFAQLLPAHPVLWVNTVGMRTPTLSPADFRKAWRKLSRMIHRGGGEAAAQESERARSAVSAAPARTSAPRVCQPLMLPFNRLRAVRRANEISVTGRVRRACREMGIEAPVVVSSVPNACDYVSRLEGSRVVYYCVDDFAQWPGLDHGLVRSMEAQLIARADVLIATSQHLYRTLCASGKPTHLLTHGVDLELFARVADREHECLAGIPSPRVGYFGLFDERSDQRLLAELAGSLPELAFVITGPVAVDVSALRQRPNVYFTGPVAYRRLPELIRGLDVLALPYVVNELSRSISPLKLKEYLATGKPVISTPIAEAVLQKGSVRLAATLEEWRSAVRESLSVDVAARRQALGAMLARESWAQKASDFLALCQAREADLAAVTAA